MAAYRAAPVLMAMREAGLLRCMHNTRSPSCTIPSFTAMKDSGEAWYTQRISGLASAISRSCSSVSVKTPSRRFPKRTTSGDRLMPKSARHVGRKDTACSAIGPSASPSQRDLQDSCQPPLRRKSTSLAELRRVGVGGVGGQGHGAGRGARRHLLLAAQELLQGEAAQH